MVRVIFQKLWVIWLGMTQICVLSRSIKRVHLVTPKHANQNCCADLHGSLVVNREACVNGVHWPYAAIDVHWVLNAAVARPLFSQATSARLWGNAWPLWSAPEQKQHPIIMRTYTNTRNAWCKHLNYVLFILLLLSFNESAVQDWESENTINDYTHHTTNPWKEEKEKILDKKKVQIKPTGKQLLCSWNQPVPHQHTHCHQDHFKETLIGEQRFCSTYWEVLQRGGTNIWLSNQSTTSNNHQEEALGHS